MRIFPILTAAAVCVALYFVILNRAALVEFAGQFVPEPTNAVTETAPVEPVAEVAPELPSVCLAVCAPESCPRSPTPEAHPLPRMSREVRACNAHARAFTRSRNLLGRDR